MNSLQNLSGLGKKIIFALMLISSLAFAVAAQNPQQEGKRYGDPGFVGEPINLKVVNADIRDILSYITEQYGINFVIDKAVGSIPVTVNVNEVPWNIALDTILQSQELGVQVKGPILRIAKKETLAVEFERDEKIRMSQLATSPLYTEFIRLNYAKATGSAQGTSFQGGVVQGSSTPIVNNTEQGILGIIAKRLSGRGSVETDSRSNTLIITDVRENIDSIRQLVVLLDQPEPQVEIETRIVIAQRNFLRDIGVQLGVNITNPFNQGGVLGATTGRSSDNPPTGQFFLTTGAFGSAQITAALNLAETKGQTKTIASPRVTALNNRKAEIESGSQIPVTTVQRNSSSGDDGGDDSNPAGVVFTTTFVNVPLRLEVTPQISDAGTVIMQITVENNQVDPSLAAGLGGTPGINTQRMQTQVLVPDGGTTVVGGVLTDLEVNSKSKTPGLGDIPILKYLFRSKTTQRNTSEILFFITPRIYRPDYEGNPTQGKIGTTNRSTTILQPVPLGNPASNSTPTTTATPQPQQILVPVPTETNPASSTKP
ncbi:MAG: type IV pilus secretin PilQ [Pyrinomonadaceae bacterium]